MIQNTFSVNLGSGENYVTGSVIYQRTIEDTKWNFMLFPYDISVNAIKITGDRVLDSGWFTQEYNNLQRSTK